MQPHAGGMLPVFRSI